MDECRKDAKSLRVLLPVVVGVAALFAVSKGPVAQLSEMDGFERAITSASEEDALAFIHEFSSSHLIPDLIELLPPDVAAAVCADLGSSVGSAAERACQQVTILGRVPSAGPTPTAPELATTEEVTTVGEDEEAPAGVGLQHDASGNEGDSSNGRTGSSSGGSSGGGTSGGSSGSSGGGGFGGGFGGFGDGGFGGFGGGGFGGFGGGGFGGFGGGV